MEHIIESEQNYYDTMDLIYTLMNKGESYLSESDLEMLKAMSISAKKFEDEVLGLELT